MFQISARLTTDEFSCVCERAFSQSLCGVLEPEKAFKPTAKLFLRGPFVNS